MCKAQPRAKRTDKSLLQTGRFVANKTRVTRHETLKSILTQIESPKKNGLSFQSDAGLDSFFEGLGICIS